jgi:hypothetical protein
MHGLNACTVMLWVRLDIDWPQYRCAIAFGGAASGFQLQPKGQNLSPVAALRIGAGSAEARGFGRIDRQVWRHLAVTYSDGTALLYLDGREAARQTGLSWAPGGLAAGSLGADATGADGFLPGALDDVRIYSVALSPAQIQVVSGVPPAPPGNDTPHFPPIRDTGAASWRAVDGLGRRLPTSSDTGPPRSGKNVGIFYFLWDADDRTGVHDITQIRESPGAPDWGPVGSFHYWDKPYFGYYYRDDPWVLRKHAQLLADAGVDVLIFDVTNGYTYDGVLIRFAEILREMKLTGIAVPQIAFIMNPDPDVCAGTVEHLYRYFFQPGLFRDLWFHWLGKPLILGNNAHASADQQQFFTWRQSWAWHDPNAWFGDGQDRWPWIDDTPQAYGWHTDPAVPEETCVGIAGHPTRNVGRSFHDGAEPAIPAPAAGLYLAEQWRRALQIDPAFIFLTGWNEWIAQRFVLPADAPPTAFAGTTIGPGDTYFVDEYSAEFSRDGEPVNDDLGDDYYYQLIDGIRHFKGIRADPEPARPHPISLERGFGQWRTVASVYYDDVGDTRHRNYVGHPDRSYTDHSGRNDIVEARVAHTVDQLSFYVRCRDRITSPGSTDWMVLYLDTAGDRSAGWNGFDIAINRSRDRDGSASVQRWDGGWTDLGTARFAVAGAELAIQVPRALCGGSGPVSLSFSWADNVGADIDSRRFIDRGDTAPNGRFSYYFAGR